MLHISLINELRGHLKKNRIAQKSIGFVPTMGALHEGHLSLVEEAKAQTDIVVVSIFVNPTQFGPNEDFDAYPRTLESDLEKLRSIRTDIVFTPSVNEIYPSGFQAKVSVADDYLTGSLEGIARPGHFDGVTTVVNKLFNIIQPDQAFFGEKDYQQLAVIQKMVRDLNMSVQVIGVPTKRDKNGLALSSRNAYLSEQDYKKAAELNKILAETREKIRKSENISEILKEAESKLIELGFDPPDYVTLCDAETLKPLREKQTKPMRLLVADRIGKTRLIDNISVV